jgi:beta-glucosidase-like glycosyl hydrolase
MKKYLILSLLFLLLTFHGIEKTETDWVENTLSSLTLREKIGQMIVSYSDGYSIEESSTEFKRLKELIENEKIGGIIFFRGNSYQQAELTNRLQSISEIPLLISADYERGTKMRLDDGSLFPNNMALGATGNPELAYRMGLMIARECRAIGVHQNYAPVMDVNNNPDNPIINVRSFGESPDLVALMGTGMIKGLQDGRVIATAKHFPGHGDTDIDSHNDLPVLNFTMDRLRNLELIPFKAAVDSGVKSVMTAHLSFPELEKRANIPASLSDKIIKDILISDLNFKGLIVTDALNMSGVTKHLSTKEVALLATEAGIDLILMPQGEKETIDAIFDAVSKGIITEERINNSARKILEVKKWLGLDENKLVDLSGVRQIINNDSIKILSQEIADASVTLVKNNDTILPLNISKSIYSIISINNTQDTYGEEYFLKLIKENGEIGVNRIYNINSASQINNIGNEINISDIIIIPVFSKVRIMTGTVGIPEQQINLINKLKGKGNKVIVISFGNPYLLRAFENIDGYICAYGDAETSVSAVYKGLLKKINFKGKLPVTINENYKIGYGLSY